MRSLVVSAAILAAAVGLSLWCGRYVEDRTTDWTAGLEEADDAAWREDWRAASLELRQVYGSWQEAQTLLHTIAVHDELEQAEGLFAGVLAACRASDGPDFHTMLAQLVRSLEHLSEAQALSVQNIF